MGRLPIVTFLLLTRAAVHKALSCLRSPRYYGSYSSNAKIYTILILGYSFSNSTICFLLYITIYEHRYNFMLLGIIKGYIVTIQACI